MLDQQQAKTILALVRRTIGVDVRDNITDVPDGFDLAAVADAVATLEATAKGEDLRPLVVEYLSRLAPALLVAGIDSSGTPSSPRLEELRLGASELLDRLGAPLSTWTRRMFVIRDGVTLDVPGWLPLEVLDALARIGKSAGAAAVTTASALANTVDVLAMTTRRQAATIEQADIMLRSLDPAFSAMSATEVEIAARSLTGLLDRLRSELQAQFSRSRGEGPPGFVCARCCECKPASEGADDEFSGLCDTCWVVVSDLFTEDRGPTRLETAAPTPTPVAVTPKSTSTAVSEKRPPGWHRVCAYTNPIRAVIGLSEALGQSISDSELGVMSLGEEAKYPSGASIIRTAEGWELWSDGGGDRG